MNADSGLPAKLVDQAAAELGFRKQILSELASLLRKKDTLPSLKILIVLGLLVILGISVVFTMFLIQAAIAAVKSDPNFEAVPYIIAIAVMVVLLMAVSVPLIVKAGSQEAALRLEDSLNRTYKARQAT